MSNQPVYRTRNHAYSCRCGRCPQSRPAGWGFLGPAIPVAVAVALVGFWPAMVWHGYTDTGGWKWDIDSTVAEAVYFGVLGFIAWMIWLGHRPARTVAGVHRGGLPATQVPPPPPAPRTPCYHLDAVPVDLSTGERVAWWCQECETQLGPEFGRLMRPCCGSAPGTRHVYNCPHLKGRLS